jgi:uncharacterized OsmC-like protein
MLDYVITAQRVAPAVAIAHCARAQHGSLPLDVDPKGRADAFNPAELLLTALAACMLKAIERVTPMLGFALEGADVRVHGIRQDVPPRIVQIDYELVIDTNESDERLDLLHRNIRQYGTVYNTLASAVQLVGTIRRGGSLAPEAEPAPAAAEAPASSGAMDEIC